MTTSHAHVPPSPVSPHWLNPSRRRRRHPSSTCACGNCGAWTRPSWNGAWPNACATSSCRPSWPLPSCARHVSSAPWFDQQHGTTNAYQLLRSTAGETHITDTQIQCQWWSLVLNILYTMINSRIATIMCNEWRLYATTQQLLETWSNKIERARVQPLELILHKNRIKFIY